MHQDELKISKIFHFGRKPPSSKPGLWPCDWPSAEARHQQRQHQFQFINYNLGHQRGIPTSDPMKSKASKVT